MIALLLDAAHVEICQSVTTRRVARFYDRTDKLNKLNGTWSYFLHVIVHVPDELN